MAAVAKPVSGGSSTSLLPVAVSAAPLILSNRLSAYSATRLSFSPDGKKALRHSGGVESWDLQTGRLLRELPGRDGRGDTLQRPWQPAAQQFAVLREKF